MPLKTELCDHLANWKELIPTKKHECEECIKSGDQWVHLRTCQTCGTTLCCDSSPNQHASKHAHQSKHAVAVSAERGENWAWCYFDEQIIGY